MKPSLSELISLLETLQQDRLKPTDGKLKLASLKSRYPAIDMKLIWEEQEYDQSVHYDVMLRSETLPGVVTVGLSPQSTLPWPMRGVHRWKEADLLRVNDVVMGMQQAISFLDFIWNDADVIHRLISTCLVEEAVEEFNLPPSTASELQAGMDAFRRGKNLLTVAATDQWMAANGLSHEHFERLVTDALFVDRLRDRITSGRIEDFFATHRADFDSVAVAVVRFATEEEALTVMSQGASSDFDFLNLAQAAFLSDMKSPLPTFMSLTRREASVWGNVVFNAAPGSLVGPIRLQSDYVLARIITQTPAAMTDATAVTIKQILFDEWLLARRQKASIEWYWGSRRESAPPLPKQA